jgi:predicted nuclease of predicted toxin-antitoxin system
VLERAYAEDRVLVTKDVEDFVKLARARTELFAAIPRMGAEG